MTSCDAAASAPSSLDGRCHTVGDGSNQAFGLDAAFSFYDNVNFKAISGFPKGHKYHVSLYFTG